MKNWIRFYPKTGFPSLFVKEGAMILHLREGLKTPHFHKIFYEGRGGVPISTYKKRDVSQWVSLLPFLFVPRGTNIFHTQGGDKHFYFEGAIIFWWSLWCFGDVDEDIDVSEASKQGARI